MVTPLVLHIFRRSETYFPYMWNLFVFFYIKLSVEKVKKFDKCLKTMYALGMSYLNENNYTIS